MISSENAFKFGEKAPDPKPPVDVSIKNSQNEKEEVKVSVPSDATMGDLRAALARQLGRSELAEVRLVRKLAGEWEQFKDSESLGTRRRIFVRGLETLHSA
eukprot:TRINITY_DN22647_c0_g1_i2.p1 TRINITY_DN22647_c0_g1~~TRINITY_DN22647_c0_g1_i2.p1  ORF type:complete len:101 (-),score=16.96 TRINITY_DN22647_c0_g1_i2:13-315(-)